MRCLSSKLFFKTRHLPFAVLLFAACAFAPAKRSAAQSLDSRKPTPLTAGENRGTIDNMVGPQYWGMHYHKGSGTIAVRFTSMGLFGNPTTTTVEVVLHGPHGEVWNTHPITSDGHTAQISFPGNFSGPGSASVEIRPVGAALVRAGGDYVITLTGDGFDFAGGAAPGAGAGGVNRIVGSYAVMVCAPDFDCQSSLTIHFAPNGTVATTDGHSGTWKLFDPDASLYTVVIGRDRWTLKLVPGRGLFGTNDLSVVIFQAIRPN